MKEEKICALCRQRIKKLKGQSEKFHQLELMNNVHKNCLDIRTSILMKYRIDGMNYIAAIVVGLFELFPELKDTESLKDYKNREEEAKLELEKIFPNLKSDIIDKPTEDAIEEEKTLYDIAKKVEEDPKVAEEAEEAQRKYGTLTGDDPKKRFII